MEEGGSYAVRGDSRRALWDGWRCGALWDGAGGMRNDGMRGYDGMAQGGWGMMGWRRSIMGWDRSIMGWRIGA